MTDFVQDDIDFMGTFMCLVMRFTKASQRSTIMSAMKALQNDKMTAGRAIHKLSTRVLWQT